MSHIDIFQCKSEDDFLRLFATEVIKQTATKLDEWSNHSDASYILSLPEKIATKQGVRVVVCIDEFQQIADFRDCQYFQKQLRSSWQHQQS